MIDKASAERASGADSRPFLLNLWHYAVHTPLQAPSDLVAAQTARAETLGRGADRDIEIGEPLPYWNTTGARVRRRRLQGNPTYAAMISNLDTNVGRVADALRRNAILDDTVVVFTSDNGGLHSNSAPTSNEPLSEGKGWLEEGGLRVPMIIKPACLRDRDAVQGGTTVHTPVSGLDLFPTLLELSGLSQLPERHLDGRSLAGLMTHPGPDIDELSRRALFWHFPHYNYGGASPCSAVRRGRWKLMRRYETATESLFELTSDPGETLNLAATEVSHRADLGRLLDDWLRDVHALVPRPNPSRQFDEYDVGSDGTTYERP
ncbi:sulfatase-like hydrolase/transferase [Kribbella aluminosa]|uniref:sulfatase-like hydrolase/transferase n=1 Tax=Kribbella aluminosa TaxID=416017 RepID=UPI00247B1076|nr:sulfatase-like hydrolase/transferase [Kribbella aluminosa]